MPDSTIDPLSAADLELGGLAEEVRSYRLAARFDDDRDTRLRSAIYADGIAHTVYVLTGWALRSPYDDPIPPRR